MTYHPPTIREHGVEAWINGRASKHPLGWGYKEWRWLRGQGQNLTALAQAMNLKTTGQIKEWIEVDNEEQARHPAV